jgi:hypothetical protein
MNSGSAAETRGIGARYLFTYRTYSLGLSIRHERAGRSGATLKRCAPRGIRISRVVVRNRNAPRSETGTAVRRMAHYRATWIVFHCASVPLATNACP